MTQVRLGQSMLENKLIRMKIKQEFCSMVDKSSKVDETSKVDESSFSL